MKILLLGKAGQIGWELQRSLAPLGEVIAPDRARGGADDGGADLGQPEALAARIRAWCPDVIVNAAGHTAVDRAETGPAEARRINTEAVGALAQVSRQIDALLVHFSSDYVFDGSGQRPWTEDDAAAPLNVYGATKLAGDRLVAGAGGRHLILRTSWVHAPHGHGFIQSILRQARTRERLSVVDDQTGAPTGADLVADVAAHAIRQVLQRPQDGGLYHLAAAGETSWHGCAGFVVDTVRELHPAWRLAVREIAPVPASAYPAPARRPANSRLDTTRLRQTFGLHLPDWREGVRRTLAEMRPDGESE